MGDIMTTAASRPHGGPAASGATVIPGYTVISHMRRGRRYDVYNVWSVERTCLCVAKVLRPDRPADSDAGLCLLREGETLARLAHIHLVRAYEVLTEPRPAVILETLTGDTLEALIERHKRGITADDVAVLGLQLCSALHYLHAHGLLHLDLKPSNIMREARYVKLIDLGLASPPGGIRPETGTPQYMAPEQVRGGEVTSATDVWGIGVTLFEAATGVMPFGTERYAYEQIKRRAVPVRTLKRIPAGLAAAIDSCLEPEPDDRPTVDELAATLRRHVRGLTTPPQAADATQEVS